MINPRAINDLSLTGRFIEDSKFIPEFKNRDFYQKIVISGGKLRKIEKCKFFLKDFRHRINRRF
jgi:hypothetical protein